MWNRYNKEHVKEASKIFFTWLGVMIYICLIPIYPELCIVFIVGAPLIAFTLLVIACLETGKGIYESKESLRKTKTKNINNKFKDGYYMCPKCYKIVSEESASSILIKTKNDKYKYQHEWCDTIV